MKLDHRRTILVGLAFLSICAFWQMYDSVIPKILTETFRLNETLSGAIMALDNILALFLLPLFGALSDRTSTKIGRRMPFILLGTACAAVLMNLLPVLDNRYAAAPSTGKLVGFAAVLGLLLVAMGTYRSPAVALMPDVTPNPLRSRANAIINLMGAVGGMIYLGIAAVLYSQKRLSAMRLTKADRLGCRGGDVPERQDRGPRPRQLSAAFPRHFRRHARERRGAVPDGEGAEARRGDARARGAASRVGPHRGRRQRQ